MTEIQERPEDRVRTASRPSELRITDLRTATVGWDKWHFTLVRIDTDDGEALGALVSDIDAGHFGSGQRAAPGSTGNGAQSSLLDLG